MLQLDFQLILIRNFGRSIQRKIYYRNFFSFLGSNCIIFVYSWKWSWKVMVVYVKSFWKWPLIFLSFLLLDIYFNLILSLKLRWYYDQDQFGWKFQLTQEGFDFEPHKCKNVYVIHKPIRVTSLSIRKK